jgi:hypothetical protein
MCWNAEVSLITFITSLCMCIYLWYRNLQNDRPISLWIFTFSLIQLFEFFMWLDINNTKGWNNLATKISLPFILLQPFVLSVSIWYYKIHYNNEYIKLLLYLLIGISGIRAILAFIYIIINNKKWISKPGKNCHLVWYFMKDKLPYLIDFNFMYKYSLILLLLMIKPFHEGLFYLLFGVITILISQYIYGLEMGSIWCWIANVLGIYAIGCKMF